MRSAPFHVGVIGLLLALAAGCAQQPKVSCQYDPKADFAGFKTYAMEQTVSPTLDLRVLEGKPLTQVIAESIEQQLDSKGLRKVPAQQADLLVRWKGKMEFETGNGDALQLGPESDMNAADSGPMLNIGSSSDSAGPEQIAVGGIGIDLVSAKANKRVWRGRVAAVLGRNVDDPKRVANLNAALCKLFANFPPPAAAAR